MRLNNSRHERFALSLASGKTASAAYEEAGYRPDRGAACRLSAKVSITDRVSEIQAVAEKKVVEAVAIDAIWVRDRVAQVIADALAEGDRPNAIRALDLMGKHVKFEGAGVSETPQNPAHSGDNVVSPSFGAWRKNYGAK